MNDEQEDARPRLTVAADNTQQDIAQHIARQEIGFPLRMLAANLIRVVRGAGAPYDVGRQCVAVIEALEKYRKVVGSYPSSHEIQDALELVRPEFDGSESDSAIFAMTRGGLRIAAANLLSQRLQIVQGEKDLMDAFYQLEAWREEQRKLWAAARRLTKPKNAKGKPKDEGWEL